VVRRVELASSAAPTMAKTVVSERASPAVVCRYKTPLAAAGAEEWRSAGQAWGAKRQVPAMPAM